MKNQVNQKDIALTFIRVRVRAVAMDQKSMRKSRGEMAAGRLGCHLLFPINKFSALSLSSRLSVHLSRVSIAE